jgi:hypothetical protein
MKILSIDFDYFFPDSSWFDWGHNENMLFLETIWSIRAADIHLKTKQSAIDYYVPTIPTDFWSLIKNKPNLFIAESHTRICQLLNTKNIIYNLDAHHDCGYNYNKSVDCGNWASHALTINSKVHIIYPTWRKTSPEHKSLSQPTSISYKLPKPQNYDVVFVCRSGCWVPTWCDTEFQKFITDSKLQVTKLDDLVWKIREPTLTQAKELKLKFHQIRKGLHEVL